MTGYVYSYSSTPTIEYVYDEYNQLTTVKDHSKNEQYSYTYADSDGWGDLLTSYNGETITYDAIGNPLTYRDGMTMTWVNGRELSSLSKDGKTYNFTYDPSGLRTKKSITTSSGSTTNVEYIYEGGQLMQMTYGNYVLDFSYDANGTPVAFHVDNGGTVDKYYYYGVNSRGDVEALYNADGTLHARYEYDAYGKILSVKASDGTNITATYAIAVLNPLRYRSYVYDNETGFYYLQSRYYDPTTCRFVCGDKVLCDDITGKNLFAYCGNNPVIRTDDSGQGWWIAAGAIIGGLVGGVACAVTNIASGEDWYDGIIGAVVGGAVAGAIVTATCGTSLAVYGGTIAAYAGAAATSLTNEVVSYVPTVSEINGEPKTKELTQENISNSVGTVVTDTIVDGTIAAVTDKIVGIAIPANNKSWFIPKKLKSAFTGKYAKKLWGQTFLQSGIVSTLEICGNYNDKQETSTVIYP